MLAHHDENVAPMSVEGQNRKARYNTRSQQEGGDVIKPQASGLAARVNKPRAVLGDISNNQGRMGNRRRNEKTGLVEKVRPSTRVLRSHKVHRVHLLHAKSYSLLHLSLHEHNCCVGCHVMSVFGCGISDLLARVSGVCGARVDL